MQGLRRDHRGYPVPVNVLIDEAGKIIFAANDERVAKLVREHALCAICGTPMCTPTSSGVETDMWLVGGPGSCFHDGGRFFDSPMHRECATYALKVCPYLTIPQYTKRIGELMASKADLGEGRTYIDPTVIDQRPPFFGMCRLGSYAIELRGPLAHVIPVRPWLAVECWQDGARIDPSKAWDLILKDGKFKPENMIWWPY